MHQVINNQNCYGYREPIRMTKTFADVSNLKIEAYSDHPEVYAVADWLVDSFMQGMMRVRDEDKYRFTARKLIASLWLRDGDMFKFTTRAANFGTGRKQVWMSKKVLKLFQHLVKTEMVRVVAKGRAANITIAGIGMNTVYCRTVAFKAMFQTLTTNDIIPNPDLPRIELRDDEKEPLEIPLTVSSQSWLKQSVTTLKNNYDLLLRSSITCPDGTPLSPSSFFYTRKFKNDFLHGGRLYASYENWSKRSRLGIQFDGQPAVSMDISQLHPALIIRLYHGLGKEPVGMLRGELEDAYDMPDYNHLPRAVHKKLINTLFNSESEDAALRSLMTAHLQPKTDDYGELEYFCHTYKGKTKRSGVKLFKDNKAGAAKYLAYFKMMHPYYAPAIGSGLGSRLQRLDSDYVLEVMRICNELECPILPVHDEFVFPEEWVPTMEIVLLRAFQSVYGEMGHIGELNVTVARPYRSETKVILPLRSCSASKGFTLLEKTAPFLYTETPLEARWASYGEEW